MSPNVRRAFHQALDLVLDALAEEASADPKPKRKRAPAPPRAPRPARELTPEERERLDRQLQRSGFAKSA